MENTSQFMELSESEMLDLWKTMMQLQPAHYGCTIERTDGIDIDELLLIHIRKWYASLLLSASDGIVPVEDVKDRLSLMVADNGVVTAMVPPECVRPVEWKLKAWQKSVTLFLQPNVPEAAYLHNEWTRPGVCDPAAVDYGNRILLFTRESSIAMFEKSLKELQTTYFDYYLWHNIGGDRAEEGLDAMGLFEERFVNNGMMDFLNKKKEEGVIRNLGFSYHGDVAVFDHALRLHDEGKVKFDFVLIELNYLDWKHAKEINDYNTNAEYLYGEVAKRGLMAFVMEPLLGGRLSNLPDKLVAQLKRRDPDHSVASGAFRYAGTRKNVLCVLSGMTYMEHLRDNLCTFSPLKPLSEAEMRFLDEDISKQIVGYNTIPCNDCKYCMPCPYGIDIPGIFVHYNKCLGAENVVGKTTDPNYEKARRAFLVGYDRSVPKLRQADHCIGCGRCVSSCPQSIRIPEELHRISAYVEALKQRKDATGEEI